MPWNHDYRLLEEGEIILPTDEVQLDDTSWEPDGGQCAGKPAPNPHYTSHRRYRRLKEQHPELKRCPLCGNNPYDDEVSWSKVGSRSGYSWAVACSHCELTAPGAESINQAVHNWNYRPYETQLINEISAYVWKELMRHSPCSDYDAGFLNGVEQAYQTIKRYKL